MNKIAIKGTARVLSVLLAILLVINVLPGSADKALQAQAASKVIEKYAVTLVDSEGNDFPADGIEVTMKLEGGNDKNDGSNVIDETAVTEVTEKTSAGVALFENFVTTGNKYSVAFDIKDFPGCEEIPKIEELPIEEADNSGEDGVVKLSVPVTKRTYDYTVKVKNTTEYKDYENYNLKLNYWSLEDEVIKSVSDYTVEGDDILSFKINGYFNESYGIQVVGEPYDPVGSTNVTLDGKTESDAQFDLELKIKQFNVTFDKEKFENGYVTVYEGGDSIEEVEAAEFNEEEALDLETYSNTLDYGQSAKYLIWAQDGYRINSVQAGTEKTSVQSLAKYLVKIDNIKQDTEISAEFAKKSYKVTFNVDANGKVILRKNSEELDNIGGVLEVTKDNTDASSDVDETSSIAIKAEANDTFHIKSFKYREAEADSKNTVDVLKKVKESDGEFAQNEPKNLETVIENIHSDYIVSAEFAVDEFNLTADKNDKGEVTFSKTDNKVQIGESVSVKVTPESDYHIDKIEIFRDDTEHGKQQLYLSNEEVYDDGKGNYTFEISDIRANVNVVVSYKENEKIPMSVIKVTSPYKKDYFNPEYARYTYRNDENIGEIYISYEEADYEYRGIEVKSDKNIWSRCILKSEEDLKASDKAEHASFNVEQTQLVESVRVYYDKQWHNVELDGGKILFILDKYAPNGDKDGLIKKPEGDWTNENIVTISGQLKKDADTASKLDCVIWSKGKKLDDDELHAIQLGLITESSGYRIGKTDIDNNRKFEFNITGQQESRYYVYALDESGNIFSYNPITVGIDNSDPTIYSFYVNDKDSKGNTVTFDEFGATATDDITVNVMAEDINSGIASITLYGYDNLVDDAEPETLGTVKNNTTSVDFTASFTISGERNISLAAVAVDRAGNEILLKDAVTMTKDNSNSFNGNIIIGKKNYDVKISGINNNDNVKYTNDNKEDWYYDNDINVKYSVEESFIGFSSVYVQIIKYDKDGNIENTIPIDNLSLGFNHDYKGSIKDSIFDTPDILNAKPRTTVDETVNIKDICMANNITLNDGKNSIKVTVYSRAHQGEEYISKTAQYDFYIDSHNPEIKKISFTKHNSTIGSVINVLTFGLFSNGDLQVDIEVDDSDSYVSSGYNRGELYNGSELISTSTEFTTDKDGNDIIRFKIPLKEVVSSENKKIYYDGDVSAKIFDNVTRESANSKPKANDTDPTRENSDITHVMIENVPPVIDKFVLPEQYSEYNENTYDGNIWYNDDVAFGIAVHDEQSGIGTVTADINGTAIIGSDSSEYLYNSDKPTVTEANKLFEEKSLVSTNADGVVMNSNGSYVLTVNAVDNAGNNANENTITVYKDTHAPTVTRFEFLTEGNSKNGDGVPNDDVELTEYGYYFKRDTQVRVYTDDVNEDGQKVPSSGVNRIYFKAVPEVSNSTSMEEVGNAYSDGTYIFTIPANFKGQIFAYADDNVGNSTNRYVTPSGTIIETPEEHEKEGHISITRLAQAPSATASGSPLYAGPVDVEFVITDTYSGINSAEITINNKSYSLNLDNNSNDIDDWIVNGRDKNLITRISRVITVSDNMNDIPITVKMTDRSGNESVKEDSFSIDTTPPTIAITWDQTQPDEDNKDFYNKQRTATITVTERNFNAKNFVTEITNTEKTIPSISGWASSGSGDSATHVTTVTFSADGDYEFSAYCFDDVGNKSSTAKTQPFTMDFTKPVVNVTYDNNDVKNGMYYPKSRTATIEITEHNFDSSRVEIKGKADDNGKEIEFPKCSDWTTLGDRHTATIKYDNDALYTFSISVRDKAGNQSSGDAEDKFCIDKSAPVIEFSGVENKSANNGDIAPIITLSDKNYDEGGVEISLVGSINKKVDYKYSIDNASLGQVYTYANFEKVKKVDDLYTLSVNLTDLAGNQTNATLNFSANRFGSVYTLDKSLEDIMNKYVNQEIDVVFTETNVDTISLGNIDMKVVKNGTPNDLKQNSEYTVEETGGDGSWSQYKYTVKSSMFTDDGGYKVDVYSIDKAKNENENIAEDKNANIEFGIDKSAPVITPINFDGDKQYNTSVLEAELEITDNIALQDYTIELDGQKLTADSSNEDGVLRFSIPESTKKQNVRITAYDSAGNSQVRDFNDILVSTNLFVRWINNIPLFVGSIIAAVLVIAGIIALIVALVRRKRSE